MELVICNNGKATTTSMKVAEYFSKPHNDVLKAIRKLLDDSDIFGRGNFSLTSYFTDQNKELPMYDLDRDGFTLLAMGFTGKTALTFKMKYIDAFNKAEQALHSVPAISADPILAIADALSMIRREQLSLGTKTEVLSVGLVETRTEVAKLKQNMRLESWQAHNVQKAVCRKVELWKEMYPSLNVKKAFPAIYRHLKDKFQVPKYDAIPSTEYDLAMTVITKLNMSGLAGL